MEDLIKKNLEYTLGEEIPEEMLISLKELSFEKSFDKKELLAEAGKACNYQYFPAIHFM